MPSCLWYRCFAAAGHAAQIWLSRVGFAVWDSRKMACDKVVRYSRPDLPDIWTLAFGVPATNYYLAIPC